MKRNVKILFFIVIFLLFIQTILLKHFREPYPAVLLPSGAFTIRDEGSIMYKQYKLFATTADGIRYEVNVEDFLSTVPATYRTYILRRNFGLLPTAYSKPWKLLSDDAMNEGRRWLQSRLQVILGRNDWVQIDIVHYRITKLTRGHFQVPDKKISKVTKILLQ